MPKVSVIIATYNRAALLDNALESILCQTMSDWELIVVNDASTDNTAQLLAEWQNKDARIHGLCTERNVGPGAARNLGFAHARGQYMAVLDDDDTAVPQRLQWQSDLLDQHPDIGLVFSSVRWVDKQGQLLNIFPGLVQRGEFPTQSPDIFQLLYQQSNKIPNTTIMFRREIFDNYGGYPNLPWIGEDWFWFMQLVAQRIKFAALNQATVNMCRDKEHVSLMTQRQAAMSAQRQVLAMISIWLQKNNIHDFDHLHRSALSNQFVREARVWGRFRAVHLCCQALFLWPMNSYAWHTLYEFAGRGWRKLVRTVYALQTLSF